MKLPMILPINPPTPPVVIFNIPCMSPNIADTTAKARAAGIIGIEVRSFHAPETGAKFNWILATLTAM